jgi:flagellar biosynthesis anti-sigma factor FlgM
MKIPPNLPAQQTQGVKAYNTQTSKDSSSNKVKSDSVSVSSEAQILSSLSQVPDIRQDKVDEIKRAIKDGSYLTEDKLNAALDNLIQDLG